MKDLKAETLEKILEAERQVMLWEKKTQLERETQVINRVFYLPRTQVAVSKHGSVVKIHEPKICYRGLCAIDGGGRGWCTKLSVVRVDIILYTQ